MIKYIEDYISFRNYDTSHPSSSLPETVPEKEATYDHIDTRGSSSSSVNCSDQKWF